MGDLIVGVGDFATVVAERLRDFGYECSHWETPTVVTALRLDGLGTPVCSTGPPEFGVSEAVAAMSRRRN